MDYEEDHQTATPESDAVLANYKSNELLAMLPNIETLRVMTQNKGWIFTPDFLDQNSALKLRKLQLPWSAASLDVIVQYLKFPKLDELHVSYTDSPYAHRLDVVQACKDQAPSGISQLFLRTSDLSFSDISMLLKLFSNLGGRRLGIVRMDAQELLSSPASVSGLLTPLRLTLVDLWLLKDGNSSFKTSHDGSRLDLSTFNVLKKLNVASDCFFADKQPGSARDGLWKLLPPRLEDIKIWFYHDQHFLYTQDELDSVLAKSEVHQCNARALPREPQRYKWLQETVIRKCELFTRLKEIAIKELRLPLGYPPYAYNIKVCRWQGPRVLKRSLAQAVIKLEVKVRRPKGRLPEGVSWGGYSDEDDTSPFGEDDSD